MHVVDVIIIGAGAAGLMCGIESGKRGRRTLILEKTQKAGKKILMSGGGRCNFTNLYIHPDKFISHNKHFCKSALNRFTQWDFIAMVEHHGIAYYEKTLGQLFCVDKSKAIVDMLLAECRQYAVDIRYQQTITSISQRDGLFHVYCGTQCYVAQSVVVASGGLSIPTLGSSPFGYQLAKQFGLSVYPTYAGLVPVTYHQEDKNRLEGLSGIALDSIVTCGTQSFREHMLFTHRGLSGPAVLQISSYWKPGQALELRFIPDERLYDTLIISKKDAPHKHLKTVLESYIPKQALGVLYAEHPLDRPMDTYNDRTLRDIAEVLERWSIVPNGTEGYRTAEVTCGGVDCDDISSKTFEAHKIPGLFFIGEVLDVTGWLGGYNFQWAWSSGFAAGQVV